MKATLLTDRGVIAVKGKDARRLLNGLLTTDIATVAPGTARFAALLSPQGKIAVDGFVAPIANVAPKASAAKAAVDLRIRNPSSSIITKNMS